MRVDFETRRMTVVCAGCRDAFVIDLAEPGLARMLSMFASNHRHAAAGPPAALEVVAD